MAKLLAKAQLRLIMKYIDQFNITRDEYFDRDSSSVILIIIKVFFYDLGVCIRLTAPM